MLLHDQAAQLTEGLAGLAFADLLGLRVFAEARPRADLSRGLAGASQRQVADAADRVALPPTACEVADGIDAGAVRTDPETKAPHELVGVVRPPIDGRQYPHVSVRQLHLPRRSRRAILHVRR